MSQYDFGALPPETTNGIQLAEHLRQYRDAQNSNHKGGAAPAYAVDGTTWVKEEGGDLVLMFTSGGSHFEVYRLKAGGDQVQINPLALGDLITPTFNVAYTGGVIGAADSGKSYSVDLAAHEQITLDAVADLPDGWNITLRVDGSPSGYQSAKVQTLGDFVFRNSAVVNAFYLIGNGEAFKVTKIADGRLLVTLLNPPGRQVNVGSYVGTAGWNSGSATWRPIPLNTSSGVLPLVQRSSGGGAVAVSGLYTIIGRNYNGVTVSGQGSTVYSRISLPGQDNSYYEMVYLAATDYKIFSPTTTAWLNQGDVVSVEHFASSAYGYYYPTYCVAQISLEGR